MDDENGNEENHGASTSKQDNKEKKDEEFGNRERDRDRERHRDDSESLSTMSDYSARSHVDVRKDGRPVVPRLFAGKREAKSTHRKKRVRRGRVIKRRRSVVRRNQPLRRSVKRKPRMVKRAPERQQRDGSATSAFTGVSTHSGGSEPRSCTHCGHRCCRRRFTGHISRSVRKMYVKKITQELKKLRMRQAKQKKVQTSCEKLFVRRWRKSANRQPCTVSGLEGIQAGSACKMLSPLMLNTSAKLNDDMDSNFYENYVEITPDMIYTALKKLMKWRQEVPFEAIRDYLKNNYPVQPDSEKFREELLDKLSAAAMTGIVEEIIDKEDRVQYWRLTCALLRRGLTSTHVTHFWEVYGDTMSPVKRKVASETEHNVSSPTQYPEKRDSGAFSGPNRII